MRRNTIFKFNPRRYDEHLSPFGRQVLKVLVKQWKNGNNESEQEHNVDVPYQQRRHRPAQKKVLTFRDSNVLPNPLTLTPTIVPYQPDQVDYRNEFNYESPPNMLFIENSVPIPSSIPTSLEIINTIDTHEETPVNIKLSSDDLIHSAFESEQSRNIVHELYNRASDDEDDDVTLLAKHTYNRSDEVKDVSWNNMFDKELLPEIHTFIATNLLTTLQKDNENENAFKFPIPKQTKSDLVLEENFNTNTIKEIKTLKKEAKRKSQPKITDAIPKKVKKAEIDSKSKTLMKNCFRKQKYTKTVKNWLNDVDPNNRVDEEIIDNPNVNYIQIEPKAKENSMESKKQKKIFENSPEDKAKKVIQAQLTNKGGVMKFGNPKDVKSNSDSKTVANEKEGTEKGNIKEKKNKIKFIAPIKSQIPVKDLTYKINTAEGKIYENYGRDLAEVRNNDVIVILVYSNGFCQLNNHHTDDTCVVEGILINIDDDNFFFLKGTEKKFGEILAKLLNDNNIICYEAKPLLIYLMDHFNFDINGNFNITDAKIGGSLVDPDNPPENFTELQKLLSFTPQYTIATECVLQKSAWYSTILKECVSSLKTLLMENLSWNVFVEIEMRLLPIIADMERRGVCVDLEKLRSMEHILLAKIKTVEQECYKAAGKVFQINSTVQVRTILYEELQLDTRSNVKIRETIAKGAKSTSESMLRSLVTAHPLPKLILEYRHLHKAHATFLTGIAQHVKEGVVKPTWVQTAAATGRIASNNPNLQAIPKAPFSLVMFPDAENNDKQVLSFRSVYTSRPGYTFLAADFKHVECRVFAHAAADTGLLEALKSPDDLFKVLASKWLKKSLSEVSVEDRERTKRIVYASLYGAGARKLMDILNVSYDQALSVIASFNRTFPALKSFGRSVVSRCSQLGGRLTTLCGRGRSFRHIASSDFTLRSHAERQAVNFVVQGSAADLCKMAMVYTGQRLRETRPPVEGHLVLQIHDELVWEVADEDLERAASIIKEVMESCGERCGMSVALPVAMSRGKDWADMTPLPLPLPHATST